MTTVPAPDIGPLRRPAVWGWMSFDFAAQPFFTVVITFVFGPYFVAGLAPDAATGQAWWAGAAALGGIVIALLAPVLGAVADAAGPRKPWIAGFALIKIAALCALWFAAPGSSLVLAALAIAAALVAAELSIVFNDAMIPSLLRRHEIGLVSNIAWGFGYAGGIVALVGVLVFLAGSAQTGLTFAGLPPLFGLDPAAGEGARATAPLAALWYAVFVLPMFLLVPDRPRPAAPAPAPVSSRWSRLKDTAADLFARPAIWRFFLARMIYQDGLNGLMLVGGAFAAGLFGWGLTESGAFGILVNIAAILGCGLAAFADRRYGSKPVIVAAILCLTAATLGLVSTTPDAALFGLWPFADPGPGGALLSRPGEIAFLVFGAMIGLAFGPIQASSRSWLGKIVAPHEAGRYFGLFALTGRIASFLAPLSIALLTAAAAAHTDPQTAARIGIAALVVFFALGLAILLTAPDPGREPQ